MTLWENGGSPWESEIFAGGLFLSETIFNKSLYYFYSEFLPGVAPNDKVSGELLSIAGLAAGRVGYDGVEAGINEVLLESDGALFYGAYDGTLTYDYTLPVASGLVPENNSSTDRGTKAEYIKMPELRDALDGAADGDVIWDDDFSLDTSSTYEAYGAVISYDSLNQLLRVTYQTDEPRRGVYIPSLFSLEVLPKYVTFRARGTNNSPITAIGNYSNLSTPIDNPSLTMEWQEYSFRTFPPWVNHLRIYQTGGTGLYIEFDDIKVQSILPAEGELNLTWQPMYSAAEVIGTVNILTTDDGVTNTLHYDADNNLLKLTDGTNTASVACTPVAGTFYSISCTCDTTNGLQISIDETAGTAVSFAGRFPTKDEMSFAWQADAPQYIKLVNFKRI